MREADEVQHLRHLAPNRVGALALHLERVGDVLGRGAVREELEVLEDAGDVAAQLRDLAPRKPAEVASGDDDAAGSRSSSLSSSRMIVDFPEPDAPTTNTNSPLSITNETSESAATFGS